MPKSRITIILLGLIAYNSGITQTVNQVNKDKLCVVAPNDSGVKFPPAAKLDSVDKGIRNDAGFQYWPSNRLDSLRAMFLEKRRLHPDNPEAHSSLGWVYYYLDSPKVAIKEFKKAMELNPNLLGPHLGLGSVYKHQEKWKEAEREFRIGLTLWPYYYAPGCQGDLKKALAFAKRDRDYRMFSAALEDVQLRQGKKVKRASFQRGPIGPEHEPIVYQGRTTVKVVGFAKDSLLFKSPPLIRDTGFMEYPAIARQASVSGTARVILSVNGKGEVEKSQLSRSSRNSWLDEAAVECSKKINFFPPLLRKKKKFGGESGSDAWGISPLLCDVVLEVDFQLLKPEDKK